LKTITRRRSSVNIKTRGKPDIKRARRTESPQQTKLEMRAEDVYAPRRYKTAIKIFLDWNE
jgi:hypothetical protein